MILMKKQNKPISQNQTLLSKKNYPNFDICSETHDSLYKLQKTKTEKTQT